MKVKIAAVSYTNTIPFIYGLRHFMPAESFELLLAYPSKCADYLAQGKTDVGLVPIAAMLDMEGAELISDFCIGANGAVETVCIYSEVPLEQVSTVLLDYQSRTSVLLLQILMKEFWQLKPEMQAASNGFLEQIGGTTAALVIGDRAFDLNHKYPYVYDLSECWKQHTGLPFVFAAWVANKSLDTGLKTQLNQALMKGVTHIDEAIEEMGDKAFSGAMMRKYLNQHISYQLDDEKRKAMQLFLEKARLLKG